MTVPALKDSAQLSKSELLARLVDIAFDHDLDEELVTAIEDRWNEDRGPVIKYMISDPLFQTGRPHNG
jgi:hypothetical protein